MGLFRGFGWLVAGGCYVVVGCGGASTSSEASTSTSRSSGGTTAGTTLGSGGGGGHIPNEREAELLGPLWIDEATLLAASGPELVELAQSIGLARGYALCRCTMSPAEPPADIEALMRCAEFESLGIVAGPDRARCINEAMSQVPGLETYLRCAAGKSQVDAFHWLESCDDIEANVEEPAPSPTCQTPPEYSWLVEECAAPHFCPDGTRVKSGRCNGAAECSDRSDEVSCFDDTGQDQVICGDTLEIPLFFCTSDCGVSGEVVTCFTDDVWVFACNDGTRLDTAVLCDRHSDCAEGEDESACFR